MNARGIVPVIAGAALVAVFAGRAPARRRRRWSVAALPKCRLFGIKSTLFRAKSSLLSAKIIPVN